jgi:hypothetical protein
MQRGVRMITTFKIIKLKKIKKKKTTTTPS